METANKNERQYMDGLRNAVIVRIKNDLERLDELLDGTEEERRKFAEYVGKIITGGSEGTWNFVKFDDPDYPFSPCYGVVFTFEYDGEPYMYGWDEGKYNIGFYDMGPNTTLTAESYILMEDILDQV